MFSHRIAEEYLNALHALKETRNLFQQVLEPQVDAVKMDKN